MNRTKRIKKILENNFNDCVIIVIDNSYLHKGHNNFDGNGQTHISIHLKKMPKFKLKRIDVHRKINSLLIQEFKDGLHSLEIKII